jgi:hypothetical protein
MSGWWGCFAGNSTQLPVPSSYELQVPSGRAAFGCSLLFSSAERVTRELIVGWERGFGGGLNRELEWRQKKVEYF